MAAVWPLHQRRATQKRNLKLWVAAEREPSMPAAHTNCRRLLNAFIAERFKMSLPPTCMYASFLLLSQDSQLRATVYTFCRKV